MAKIEPVNPGKRRLYCRLRAEKFTHAIALEERRIDKGRFRRLGLQYPREGRFLVRVATRVASNIPSTLGTSPIRRPCPLSPLEFLLLLVPTIPMTCHRPACRADLAGSKGWVKPANVSEFELKNLTLTNLYNVGLI